MPRDVLPSRVVSVIVEHVVDGGAAAFHARDLPSDGEPHLWWFHPDRAAVVLGSTQNQSSVDLDTCSRLGLDVVKRRSGGGAVLVGPDLTLWLDVLVPREHALWDDDIGRATWWLGETWAEALAELGLTDLVVHRGGLESSTLSRVVCFAGRGPGEVFLGSAKVVGISQRRTREWARFQCALSLRWDADTLAAALASETITSDVLRGLGSSVELDRRHVEEVVTCRMTERLSNSVAR